MSPDHSLVLSNESVAFVLGVLVGAVLMLVVDMLCPDPEMPHPPPYATVSSAGRSDDPPPKRAGAQRLRFGTAPSRPRLALGGLMAGLPRDATRTHVELAHALEEHERSLRSFGRFFALGHEDGHRYQERIDSDGIVTRLWSDGRVWFRGPPVEGP